MSRRRVCFDLDRRWFHPKRPRRNAHLVRFADDHPRTVARRSRFGLSKAAYRTLSAEHDVYKQYIPSAFEVAIGTLKAYRRRIRGGKRTTVPYLRRLVLKAENQTYRLDRASGRLRIPIRGTESVQLTLPLSMWHRSIMADPPGGLRS